MRRTTLTLLAAALLLILGVCTHVHRRPCEPCPPAPPCPPGPGDPGPGPGAIAIEINNTPATKDDYVTWAPTFCRIRQAPSATDLAVVLTNDPPGSIPTGGDVNFAAAANPWPHDATATAATLALVLPQSGAWVDFVIAGKYQKPSRDDKDAVIEVHKDVPGGDVLATHALMVRVRKDANGISTVERDRFLAAWKAFRNQVGNDYILYQDMHRLASTAGNEAHQQPSFFPWHRAYLLQVERELQKIDPSVALHYWNWDLAAPNIFTADFMGAPGAGAFIGEPTFSGSNPLLGWNTDLPFAGSKLQRTTAPEDHGRTPEPGVFKPLDHPVDPSFVDRADFGPNGNSTSFSTDEEWNGHNPSHGWACTSGHLGASNRSSADPMFFLLHAQVDRQWAYWQWKKNRFGVDGGGTLNFPAPAHYDNVGKWDDPASGTDWQRGSFLDDTLWPWDGTTGGLGRAQRPPFQGPSVPPGDPAVIPNGLPLIPNSAFPASLIANLWPPAPALVRNRDLIDYLGRFRPSDGLGFCYDDVPYQ